MSRIKDSAKEQPPPGAAKRRDGTNYAARRRHSALNSVDTRAARRCAGRHPHKSKLHPVPRTYRLAIRIIFTYHPNPFAKALALWYNE